MRVIFIVEQFKLNNKWKANENKYHSMFFITSTSISLVNESPAEIPRFKLSVSDGHGFIQNANRGTLPNCYEVEITSGIRAV